MDASTRKHERIDNESNSRPKRQNSDFRFSCKREFNRRQKIETFEQNEAPSNTMLYDLPLEMLDILLQKSYLHWILNSSTKQRDEEVIRSLISVDVCFFQRITRNRFKKAIWRYLKDLYGKIKKRSAIIRKNKNYLLENIRPNDEFIASLLSLNCITEVQWHLIQRQCSTRDKNAVLLCYVEPFDEKKFSNFVKCLRQTNQKTVARIIENGGGVIKIEVQAHGARCTVSMETELLHQKFEDLQNRTKTRLRQTDKIISQLKDKGIEILNSHVNRQTVVIWIWCHLQAALEHIQKLYESNQLRDVVFESIQRSISMVINIDRNQFKKTIVECSTSFNLTHRIEIRGNEVRGVTKLQNEIYVLCQSSSDDPNVILVFEDHNPFHRQKKIRISQIEYPFDIGAIEKESCLYVIDRNLNCVWKITRETEHEYKITKWLTSGYTPRTLSVSADGLLLVVSYLSSILMMYGSDAELIRSIQLPRDIKDPRHAVETSVGNFIILHYVEEEEKWMEEVRDSESSGRYSVKVEKEEDDEEEKKGKEKEWLQRKEGKSGLSRRKRNRKFTVSELTGDGQMVIHRFSPSNEMSQKLNEPRYLSLDSDDQVFVAETWNGRVIFLDSNLEWSRILCPTKEETEDTKIRYPWSLCYDKEKKQLIVGGFGVNVYTLTRN